MGLKTCADEKCGKEHYRKGIYCSDACRKRKWERGHHRSQVGRNNNKKNPSTNRNNRADIIKKLGVKRDAKQ